MKIQVSLIWAVLLCGGPVAFGDAASLYDKSCASCHGKDGSGTTKMGKKTKAKDYRDAKVQASFTDAEGIKVIKDGKGKMKGYKNRLADADCKALMDYIRAFKK
jgi:cytochrome c6